MMMGAHGTWQTTGRGRGTWQTTGGGGKGGSVVPALATVALVVLAVVVAARAAAAVLPWLIGGVVAFVTIMAPVVWGAWRSTRRPPPWLRQPVPAARARVTLRAAPERRASIEAPQRAIEGRVVTGSAATVPMSPARRTAGRREWQRER